MQTKRILIAAFAVLSVVAVLDIVRPSAGMFGGVFDQRFVSFDSSVRSALPPDFERSRSLERVAVAQGERLSVDGTIGDLEVREAASGEAAATYTVQVWGSGDLEAFANEVAARWIPDGGGVRLVVESPPELPRGVRGFQVDVALDVPQGADVAVNHRGNLTIDGLSGELQLSFTGGQAQVRDVRGPVSATGQFGSLSIFGAAGPVFIDHSGGELVVREVAGDVSGGMKFGEVVIASVDGDVEFEVSQGAATFERIGGNLELSADFGSFDVAEVRGFVDADLRMGDMSIDGLQEGADLRVQFGDLTVRLAPGGGWNVDAIVEMGGLDTGRYDLQRTESGPRTEVKGVIGDGSNPLSVDVKQGAAKLL